MARREVASQGIAGVAWLRRHTNNGASPPHLSLSFIMNIKYCFRQASCINGIDAEIAAAELARIHSQNGILTPSNVLDAAQDAANPLHSAFEWNDEKAAHEYRKGQAQNLIYSVRIVREDGQQEPVYIHSSSSGGYAPTEEIVKRVDLLEEAKAKARARLADAENSLIQLEFIARRHRSSMNVKPIIQTIQQAQKSLQPAH